MDFLYRLFGSTLVAATLAIAPAASADTSIANIVVSGYVPSFFSVVSTAQPADLDLSPGVVINGRTIGTLAFLYNISIQSLTVASSTMSGAPEDVNGNPYQFGGTGDFQIAVSPGCDSVAPAYQSPFIITNVPVDIKSAAAAALVNSGVQEQCQVSASYVGTNTTLPMAGRFEMRIVVTMVSI